MKSPITGKEMKLLKEQREIVFRKEAFKVLFHFWKCQDSGEQFTTTELDEINLAQAYNQFRSLHHLPFPDEIMEIRSQYGLSAARMSEILGFGTNVYRQYEAGEVPSESNARLIQLANDPLQFKSLVMLCSSLETKVKDKLLHRIEQIDLARKSESALPEVVAYLVGQQQPDEFSGFRKPNLKKFEAMVVMFASALKPWKTKLNKLLFYADFLHFSKTCHSISGMRYDAIQMGPVPHNFQGLYQLLADQNSVAINYMEFPNGSIGEKFDLGLHLTVATEVLSQAEKSTIVSIIDRFEKATTQEMVFASHLERAWVENFERSPRAISYLKYGFVLGIS